jgi:hypothetical protein
MNKTPIAIALERQIPEHIREEYALFVDFIKAYYAFLEQTQQRDLEDIRSIDRTLDEFVIRFKRELSALFPTTGLEDERFILQRLREFYKSRGSKESYQFLFRAFFNRDAEIVNPSTQILRASDGKWQQEKSIFVEAYSGKELFELAGKIIKLKTLKKHIDVYCPRVKYYRAGMYEVFIDRAYTSDISINDVVSYNDIDVGTITPCPAKYSILRSGSGFEVGKLYNLPSESGDGSVIKITKVDSNGGIKKIQIISFGLDYETTFFAKLSSTYYQPLEYFHPVSSATLGAYSYNGQTTRPSEFWPSATFNNNVVNEEGVLLNPANPGAYGDTSLGYTEFGYINRNDYFLYQIDYKGSNNILDITESNPDNEANAYYADGTYVGEIIASFYTNASNSVVIDETLAEIQIDLGAVAAYPGYYSASDGFISDEIYIQDGRYYQLFSYVLKVEEQLDTYSELVKSLLHPAGFELFAQYNIKNEYLVSAIPLEAFVRYQYFERVFARDASYWAMHKDIANSTLPTIDNFITYHLDRTGIIDNIESFDTYRNLAQPSIHLNKWDITMGNETNPLEDSLYTAVGNFENRVLGDTDTMQWERTLLGDFIESVIETVTGRAIVKGVSTEAPIEAAFATAAHSPGFDWEFAGATWRDDTGLTIDVRSSAQNPSVWTLGVSTEAPLRNSPADARDYFNRADAASSSIAYDRSIIPLAQDSTLPTTEGISLRAFDRTGIEDSTSVLTYSDNYSYEWAKFKQPIMGPYTATLVAGSTDVILTGLNGVVFNTFAGLTINKVSGTGAFGANATVATVFVTPNNKFTTSVVHATSGTITFTISSSDTDGITDFNADLNGYVTAAQSNGIGWELGSISSPNPAFIKTVLGVDSIPRDNIVITYNRSTIPLEQTNVTAYSDGLGWDISGFSAFTDRQTITVSQNISLREITQSYSGVSGETISTVHSGMNWSFSGDTFNETYGQISTGQTMNHVAAHDFTLGDCSYLWIMAANNTSGDATENLFILLIKTFITKGSVASITSTGAYYGAFSDPVAYPTTIRGIDSVLVSDYYNGIIDTQSYGTINEDISFVKARIERFISYVARQTFGGRLQSFINRGWMISTAKKNIALGLQNTNTIAYDQLDPYRIGSSSGFASFSLSDIFNFTGCTVTQSGTQLTFTNATASSRAIVVAAFEYSTGIYYVPVQYIYVTAYSSTTITLPGSQTITKVGVKKIFRSTNSTTIDIIDPYDIGTLYYDPYNIEGDALGVSSYNSSGTYFALDVRAFT